MELPHLHIDTTEPQLQRSLPERHTIAVSSPVEAQRKPFFDGIFDSPKRRSTGSLPKTKLTSVDKTPLMSTDDFHRGSQITEDFQIESLSSQNTDYNYYPTYGGGSDDTTRLNDYPPLQHDDSKEANTSASARLSSDAAAPHHSHRRVSSGQTYTSAPRTSQLPSARFSSSVRSLPPFYSSNSSPPPQQQQQQQRQGVQSARSSYLALSNRLSSQKLAYLDGVNNVMVPSGLPNVVVRVERDYTLGDGITQFEKTFPLELQGRVCGIYIFGSDICVCC
ncbi:hypothetical protein BC937DRAFT_89845 [Endogone sp. FLAS-F59071]|nr:hypothetical protein BC937DRAFT_89845 [Endogone sp. FLAS-F59071]|eukprot:RUS22270.1 hypothetical protein BC937DRAFT_89845 [Endogone sp. FLAS-F59071]